MVKVGTLLGGELNATRAQMEEVFQFEKKLAEIYEPKERLRNMEEIYHKITVADLQQLAPAVRKYALQGWWWDSDDSADVFFLREKKC